MKLFRLVFVPGLVVCLAAMAPLVSGLLLLGPVFSAPVTDPPPSEPKSAPAEEANSSDPLREMQRDAVEAKHADWGYWGVAPAKYSTWTTHSNRLIPVYIFGGNLKSVAGENSPYRSRPALHGLYGTVPEGTLNPQADYLDQTDIYRLQHAAAAAGKTRIILVVFDGMDWQTTRNAAIYRTGEVAYDQGRGSGLHFQDYRGAETDFGYMVTSPHNHGTKVDVNVQAVLNPGGTLRGGYDWKRAGATPWFPAPEPEYLIAKSREQPQAYTDSSSSATSMTTGIKTFNGAVNVDINGEQVSTIAHQLQERGFAVGAVSSVPISHATPAAAYAHNVDRDDFQDLSRDMLGLRSIAHRDRPLQGMDVVVTAGWGENVDDDKLQGRNFVPGNRFLTDDDLKAVDVENGGRYRVVQRTPGVRGSEALAAAASEAAERGLRLLGFFGIKVSSHLPFQTADGDFRPTVGIRRGAERYTPADLHENPTLAEMSVAALEVLSQNKKGFWLMIEAGDVDWANHDNNLDNSIGAVFSGDDAVRAVTDWIETHGGWDDTVLIVTADHGHFFHLTEPEAIAEAAQAARRSSD